MTPSPVAKRLARVIEQGGPIPVAQFMAEANAHYYATRDPLGAGGDFITAPEISQMFGELCGLWLADLWLRAGSPITALYAELGPGRGTLAADALRAMRAARLDPPVHFVETSAALRTAQAERVAGAHWHDAVAELPTSGPLLIVANEFFDALPVRQLVATANGWRERVVALNGSDFVATIGPRPMDAAIPPALIDAPPGAIIETSPAANAIAAQIATRIADQGGAALFIDYGYSGPATGDTLQAVKAHAYADPFADPGERDLTAHVDFAALAQEGRAAGLRICGPIEQGDWLNGLGIAARAASLMKARPERADEIAAARDRLVKADQMGRLFKVLAFVSPDWPEPEGFR
ncbi:class I SAM-dependent methyltransferase [Sphingobium boeckii]|uniref:SAM-dependent MidA family methyltransferase n=1 Tax=Sphingobium boeckii TaxID=1082345 RepID=A0A7W9AIH8_9SPHN|nr:SAM-dependent methyltransferase [Sphingobium boeckii]MBB5686294.1 SAM-dependent MidA family methyltransferase [Sphingobium boeckii]